MGLRRLAAPFDVLQLLVDLRQRLPERLHDGLDRSLTAVQIDGGGLLKLAKRSPGELKKRLVVVLQRVGREGGEGIAKLGFRGLQQGQLFRRYLTCRNELGGKSRRFLTRARKVLLEPGALRLAMDDQRPQFRDSPGLQNHPGDAANCQSDSHPDGKGREDDGLHVVKCTASV